jgi:hypothetical protein
MAEAGKLAVEGNSSLPRDFSLFASASLIGSLLSNTLERRQPPRTSYQMRFLWKVDSSLGRSL